MLGGNIGVGTQAPQAGFDVSGTLNVSGASNLSSTTIATTANVNGSLILGNSASFTGSYAELASRPWLTVYNAFTISAAPKVQTNSIMWCGTAATAASGAATFYPTTTNTSGGTPLFSTLLTVQATAVVNTTTAGSVAYTGISSANTKVVVINAATAGTTNAVVAATGTVVYLQLVGY